jgi:hypothetical protein
LKRTCRIEVVRYTRQITVRGGESAPPPDVAESLVAALLLEAQEAVTVAPEAELDGPRSESVEGPAAPRRSRFRRLTGWLRWD